MDRIDLERLVKLANLTEEAAYGITRNQRLRVLQHEVSPEVIKALCEVVRAAQLAENALANFLENSSFDVAVGGNPIVVDGMLAHSRDALARTKQALEPFTQTDPSSLPVNDGVRG